MWRILNNCAVRFNSTTFIIIDWQIGLALSVLIIFFSMLLSYIREAALDEIDAQDAEAEVQDDLNADLPVIDREVPIVAARVPPVPPPAPAPAPIPAPGTTHAAVPTLPGRGPTQTPRQTITTLSPDGTAAASGASDHDAGVEDADESDLDAIATAAAARVFGATAGSNGSAPAPLAHAPFSPPAAAAPARPAAPVLAADVDEPDMEIIPLNEGRRAPRRIADFDDGDDDDDDDDWEDDEEDWEEIPLTHFIGLTGSLRDFCTLLKCLLGSRTCVYVCVCVLVFDFSVKV
jgi:hypothetical protein